MHGRHSGVSFMHGDHGKAVSSSKESSAKQILFLKLVTEDWGEGGCQYYMNYTKA